MLKFNKKHTNLGEIKYVSGENEWGILGALISGYKDINFVISLLSDLNIIFSIGDKKIVNELGYYDEGNGYIEHEPMFPNLPYVEMSDAASLMNMCCYKDNSYLYYKDEFKLKIETGFLINIVTDWKTFLMQK